VTAVVVAQILMSEVVTWALPILIALLAGTFVFTTLARRRDGE
jgi:uncharacterized membrane protein (DUF485 family)